MKDKTSDVKTIDLSGVNMRFVLIPSGRFLMGSPDDEPGRNGNEGPRHVVTIKREFRMLETPVTQLQYTAVMGYNPSCFIGLDMPVESVSWNEAVEFCRRLGRERKNMCFRLPSEAEWEYACRAGTQTELYNGPFSEERLNAIAWYWGNSKGWTHPVKQKASSKQSAFIFTLPF